jgi:hypothetical protein
MIEHCNGIDNSGKILSYLSGKTAAYFDGEV